jgi:hypothetical protein
MKKVIAAALFIAIFSSVAISFSSTNNNSSSITKTSPSVIIKDFQETN